MYLPGVIIKVVYYLRFGVDLKAVWNLSRFSNKSRLLVIIIIIEHLFRNNWCYSRINDLLWNKLLKFRTRLHIPERVGYSRTSYLFQKSSIIISDLPRVDLFILYSVDLPFPVIVIYKGFTNYKKKKKHFYL